MYQFFKTIFKLLSQMPAFPPHLSYTTPLLSGAREWKFGGSWGPSHLVPHRYSVTKSCPLFALKLSFHKPCFCSIPSNTVTHSSFRDRRHPVPPDSTCPWHCLPNATSCSTQTRLDYLQIDNALCSSVCLSLSKPPHLLLYIFLNPVFSL